MLNVKAGVIFKTLTPEMRFAEETIERVWAKHGLTPTITSADDSAEGRVEGTKHGQGLARDIRLNDVPSALRETLRSEVQAILGPAYYTLVHGAGSAIHLHVEYDG